MSSLRKMLQEACPGHPLLLSIPDLDIQGIECDSRRIEKGFVFVAIRGTKQDGNVFIEDAIRRGAAAVIAEETQQGRRTTPWIVVPDTRRALAHLAASFYSHPSAQMRTVGITGTNGKTTSSFLVEQMLAGERRKVGVLGTVNYRFAGREIPAVETTPGPLRLQALLSEMKQNACEYAVMEVSAHAIDQSRAAGIHFESVLFTNLTQDHLDYFSSLESYFECKAQLFTSLSSDQCAVLNEDDARIRSLKPRTRARVLTFGIGGPADLKAEAVVSGLDGTQFRLVSSDGALSVRMPLTGLHNVYNALGSLAVMKSLGFNLASAAAHLTNFTGVPGRLEKVDRGQNFFVFVDYAHTPDGLENVLRSLKPYKQARLITLFGCGGDRDKGKRPKMADIASRYSDYVIVTSDNPRSEDAREIARQVCAGFPSGFKDYSTVLDRKKAIRQALLSAKPLDIVLLAGKGHETVQIIGNEQIPFNDREEAGKVLDGH